jgi:hypothetical protein
MAGLILTADRRTRPSQKSPAQGRLDDLVEALVDQEPRHGYDACNLVITNEQAAIVIAVDPDVADDIADACDNEALCRLLCASHGEQAQYIALVIAAKTVALAREGAKRALLQLVIAESERRQEDDDLLPRRAMNHACVVPYDEERRL